MKIGQIGIILSTLVGVFTVSVYPSQAGTFADPGGTWSYTIDPSYDSLAFDGNGVVAGGTGYEIYGSAFKDEGNSIILALTANLPITGQTTPTSTCLNGECYSIPDGNIGWGDWLLDFSGGGNFKVASDAGTLIGIRFAPHNGSATPGIGVYAGVQAKSVVTENFGWSNLNNHNAQVVSSTGQTAGMGDLAWNDPYYADYNSALGSYDNPSSLVPNVIGSYTSYLGGFTYLSDADLQTAEFDSSLFPALGSQTIALRIDKSVLFPQGLTTSTNFVASLLEECNNDAIAVVATVTPIPESPEEVPEPSAILGLLAVSGMLGVNRIRRRVAA